MRKLPLKDDGWLEYVERIFTSRWMERIQIAVMIFAVLYFLGHIIWWIVRPDSSLKQLNSQPPISCQTAPLFPETMLHSSSKGRQSGESGPSRNISPCIRGNAP